MTTNKIKFVKETSDKMFINNFTGRLNSFRYIAVDNDGKKGCLPGETKPYAPIGGINTLKEVLDILVFI